MSIPPPCAQIFIKRDFWVLGRSYAEIIIRDFRFNDSTATRTSKRTIGIISKTTTPVARASHFFVHFFAVLARLRRQNA